MSKDNFYKIWLFLTEEERKNCVSALLFYSKLLARGQPSIFLPPDINKGVLPFIKCDSVLAGLDAAITLSMERVPDLLVKCKRLQRMENFAKVWAGLTAYERTFCAQAVLSRGTWLGTKLPTGWHAGMLPFMPHSEVIDALLHYTEPIFIDVVQDLIDKCQRLRDEDGLDEAV